MRCAPRGGTPNRTAGYRKLPIAANSGLRHHALVRRARPSRGPGRKRKGGKSRVIGISGLGRFFLFFPDLFLAHFLIQPGL